MALVRLNGQDNRQRKASHCPELPVHGYFFLKKKGMIQGTNKMDT
jgi:hypothetical protein